MSKPEITALQQSVLDCLALGMGTKEIAAECNCSEISVKKIRTNKKLRAIYSEACYDVIRGLVPRAVKELDRIISDPQAMDNLKLAAIKQVLEISRISDAAGAVQQDINITVSYE